MNLHILSDIHLEFEAFDPPDTDADVVILAGDIHVGRRGLDWALTTFADKPVIYVPGNHEYYGRVIPVFTDKLGNIAAGTNVHILDGDSVSFDGVTFLGSTLWTDFELFGNPGIAGFEAAQKLTDYRKIRTSPKYSRLRSLDTAAFHFRSRDWLRGRLRVSSDTTVVVTHHGPSVRSLGNRRQDDLLNAAYVSNLDELVAASKAALWVHGHLHASSNYVIGATRIICNPKGYPDEPNDHFNPGLVVSV